MPGFDSAPRTQNLLRAVCLITAFAAWAPALAEPLTNQNFDEKLKTWSSEPIDTLSRDVQHEHPFALDILAERMFAAGRRDESVFWYYEGELRWRAHLVVPEHSAGNSESDMFVIVSSDVGSVIKLYAFGDIPALLKTFSKVREWDEAHPDDFAASEESREKARAWLKGVAAYAASHQAEMKRKHDEEENLRSALKSPGDPYSGTGETPFFAIPKRPYDAQDFARFKPRITAKSDVVRILGVPDWWTTDKDHSTLLSYTYEQTLSEQASSSPFPELKATARVDVSFKFDANKVLIEVHLPDDPVPDHP